MEQKPTDDKIFSGFAAPLKRHYHHHYRKRFPRHHSKIFIFDIALIATIIVLGALATYFFLFKPIFRPIEISAAPPAQKIIIGTENSWEVHLKNTEKKTLHALTTALTFPESFQFTAPVSDTSASSSPYVWRVNTLSAGATTILTIRGMIRARVQEPVKIIAETSGLTEKNEPFSETNIITVAATDPALLTTLSIPQFALAGETFPLVIAYTNQSETPLTDTVLRFALPSALVVNNKPSEWQNQSIIIPSLAPGAHGTLNLTGVLTSDPNTSHISIGLHTSAKLYGQRVDEEDLVPSMGINPTGIKLSITHEEANATPGAPLHVRISLTHSGTQSFDALSLCIPINPHIIDINHIQGNGTLAGGAYCLTPETLPELAHISPGFHNEWPLTLALLPTINLSELGIVKNATLTLSPHATLSVSTTHNQLALQGTDVIVPLTTTLNIQAMGRYFTNEGDQLGRGPLPPQADKTTKYWIAWALRSSTNSIKHIALRAVLPSGIEWTGKSSVNKGKSMQYDPIAREVSWTEDIIEPTTDGCACAEGGFEVSLTPTTNDIGTVPMLLKNISADAIDEWTDDPVHDATADITADLTSDPLARGKGRVQP